MSEPCLHEAFLKCHARAMADKDEYAKALWTKVLEQLQVGFRADLIALDQVWVVIQT